MTLIVLGYGAVGRAVTQALASRGEAVTVAQRTRPTALPPGVGFIRCDVTDKASVRQALKGATQVVLSVGFAYDSRLWSRVWPATMANVLDACAEEGARLVFVDNLYQLGPQRGPRTEDMKLSDRGRKPAILSGVTCQWQAAAKAGRVKVAALRCSDFYGPGVPVSHIGDTGFGRLAAGKPALLIAPPDTPHDFAYVPDIARAVLTLLYAPDDAFGQVWNMPCAPTLTPRQVLALGAEAIGVKPRITAVPLWLLPVMGLFTRFMAEVADVSFTWDRPYVVDGSKFTRRFDFQPTSYEVGAPETARAFRRAAQAG